MRATEVGVRSLASLPAKTPGATLLRSLQLQPVLLMWTGADRTCLFLYTPCHRCVPATMTPGFTASPRCFVGIRIGEHHNREDRPSFTPRVAAFAPRTPLSCSTWRPLLCLVDQRWCGVFESLSLRPSLRSSQISSGVRDHTTHQCVSLGPGREPSMREQGESLASGFTAPWTSDGRFYTTKWE